MADAGGFVGVFDRVSVVASAFDDAGAGAVAAGRVQLDGELGVDVG
jgi:hypothetical protein